MISHVLVIISIVILVCEVIGFIIMAIICRKHHIEEKHILSHSSCMRFLFSFYSHSQFCEYRDTLRPIYSIPIYLFGSWRFLCENLYYWIIG